MTQRAFNYCADVTQSARRASDWVKINLRRPGGVCWSRSLCGPWIQSWSCPSDGSGCQALPQQASIKTCEEAQNKGAAEKLKLASVVQHNDDPGRAHTHRSPSQSLYNLNPTSQSAPSGVCFLLSTGVSPQQSIDNDPKK